MSGPLPARSSGPLVLDHGGGDRTAEKLLDGRYRLLSVIAVGGMGRVWRAVDTRLDRPVAVKVLRAELSGDETFRSRFRTEARHAGRLSHPNIAAVHDYGECADPATGDPIAYLVMELVDGEPLSQLLQRTPVPGLERSLDIVRQTASALAAAHAAGVVHRDVKPANVLLDADGVVKLTDFGIAWTAADAKLTSTGHVLGTPHYLSPEQVQGGRATAASDVYALGVVAYECLAGRRPFEGQTSVETALMHTRETAAPLPDSVPAGVRALVQRAMAREATERPADGAALREAVEALRSPAPRPEPAAEQDQSRTMALTLGKSRPARSTAVLPVVDAPSPAPVEHVPMPVEEPQPADEGARASRRRTLVVMLGAAAAVALVLLVLGLVGSSSSSSTGPAAGGTPAAAPSTPATVRVVAGELIGQQFDAVQARLTGAGLQVVPEQAETSDLPAGQVFAVSPEGELAPGSTVTVTYAVAPLPTAAPQPAAVLAPEPVAATTAAPSPEPAPQPVATSAAPSSSGKDNGNRHRGRNHRGDD